MCSILMLIIITMESCCTPKFSSPAELHPQNVREKGTNIDKINYKTNRVLYIAFHQLSCTITAV